MKLFALLVAAIAAISSTLAAMSSFGLNPLPEPHNLSSPNRLASRAYEDLTNGGRAPWPAREPNQRPQERMVPYCYVSPYARQELYINLEHAIELWIAALGGRRSQITGHCLGFRELTNVGSPVYCYSDYQRQIWNPDVPADALAVHWWQKSHALSSVGYAYGADSGRHYMYLGSQQSNVYPQQYAHELGHVLGLLHEHQREDRDQYIRYRPQLIEGFSTAVLSAMTRNPTWTREQVISAIANDASFAAQFWTMGTNFAKGPRGAGIAPKMLGAYDVTSIMHYDSRMGATDQRRASQGDTAVCPILNAQGGIVYTNMVVSYYDVEFVRRFYPWTG